MDDLDPVLIPAESEPLLIPVEPPSAPAPSGRSLGKLALLLAALSLVGSLAVLPFSYTLLKGAALMNVPERALPFVLGLGVALEFVFSVVAIALGLWVGPRLGLIPPLLHPAPSDVEANGVPVDAALPKPGWRWRMLGLALATGVILGVAIGAAGHFTDRLMPKPPHVAAEHKAARRLPRLDWRRGSAKKCGCGSAS